MSALLVFVWCCENMHEKCAQVAQKLHESFKHTRENFNVWKVRRICAKAEAESSSWQVAQDILIANGFQGKAKLV